MPGKLLVVSEQLQTSQELVFDKPRLTIGRKAGNDLYFNRAEISGTHAAFLLENNQYFVQDLGSTNGTFMNGGQLVAHQKYPLTPQDEVMITPYRITLELPQDIGKTFAEMPAKAAPGRRESGTIIDVAGRVPTGTAEQEAPQSTKPTPAATPPPRPAPATAQPKPQPAPAAAPKPAPEPPAPKPQPAVQPAAPKPGPKPAPVRPVPARPAPAPAAYAPEEDEDLDLPVLPGSAIGDYLWLGIGAICFITAIGLILYLIFGF